MKPSKTIFKCAIFCLLIGLFALSASPLFAAPKPTATPTPTLSAEDISSRYTPAMVVVQTSWFLEYTVYDLNINTEAIQSGLLAHVLECQRQGMESWEILPSLVNHYGTLLQTNVQKGASLGSASMRIHKAGPGFIVSADGYIATAAHNVEASQLFLKQQFIESQINLHVNRQIASLSEQFRAIFSSYNSSSSALQPLAKVIESEYIKHLEVKTSKQASFVFLGNQPYESDISEKSLPATICKTASNQDPDLAIIKIQGQNLPTVKLSKQPITLGSAYQFSYKAFGQNQTALHTLKSSQKPTLSPCTLTETAQLSENCSAIVTNAMMHTGNAGSPIISETGEVIGMGIFPPVTEENPESFQPASLPNSKYMLPVSYILDALQTLGVNSLESAFSNQLALCYSYQEQGKYKKALTALTSESIDQNYPDVQALHRELIQQQDQETSNQPSLMTLALIGIGILVVLAAATIIILVLHKKKKQAAWLAYQQAYANQNLPFDQNTPGTYAAPYNFPTSPYVSPPAPPQDPTDFI